MKTYISRLSLLVSIIFISCSFLATGVWAGNKNIELRLDRLERMLEHNSSAKIILKIKTLQSENQQLRSQLEELSFQYDKLKNRIYVLNEDMDRRVVLLENNVTNDNPLLSNISNANEPKIEETEKENNLDNLEIEQQIQEQKIYESAFNQLKAQRYGKAEQSFKLFLTDFPNSSYAPIAQYWLAESSYAQRNFKQSIKNYSDLLSKYKDSHKRIESKLKIAYCYYELGEEKQAKIWLQNIIKDYPNSTEAGQAKHLLKKIK